MFQSPEGRTPPEGLRTGFSLRPKYCVHWEVIFFLLPKVFNQAPKAKASCSRRAVHSKHRDPRTEPTEGRAGANGPPRPLGAARAEPDSSRPAPFRGERRRPTPAHVASKCCPEPSATPGTPPHCSGVSFLNTHVCEKLQE